MCSLHSPVTGSFALPGSAPTLLVGLVALLVLTAGFYLGIRLARLVLARRAARTRRVGQKGGRKALALLESAGFRVLETEVTRRGVLEIDGESLAYHVRADAIVERRRRRYVAEFKGGGDVSRITHRRTRRQLLEYAYLFGVDAVLLVDANRGRIHQVRFPSIGRPG